jgi:serine/threonine protein kinase
MSPEQVRGQAADCRSDIFALGAVLHEMLTGKRVFHRPTPVDTMSAILNEEPPSISQAAPDTSLALQRVVHRCLEKDPEQRFQSASDLAFALQALSDSSAISPSAVALSRGNTTQKEKKPSRVRSAVAAVALLPAA